MIDKRSLLLGLGIGLIAGALLLQLMLAGKEQSERLADIGRLAGEDALYSQSEVDALVAEAEERARRQFEQESAGRGAAEEASPGGPAAEGAADGGEPSGGSGGQTEGADGNAAEGGTEDDAASGAETGLINIRIRPGMTLTETAKLLEAEGVIDDAEALMKEMARMSTRIRAGYYTFTGNETIEEVRTIITSPPAE